MSIKFMGCLLKNDFYTVYHKYNFKDPITGVHTQHGESYNKRIKMEIKKRKGIISGQHQDSLLEIV